MRCSLLAFCLMIVAGAWAAPPASAPAPTARPSATVPPKSPTPADNEAAKHAKRTACLGQARARKLVGAQKTAFLKDCIGAG
jgi:hypothetical protein